MMRYCMLVSLTLTLFMGLTHAAKGPVAALPLEGVVTRADAVAIVRIGSACVSDLDDVVKYGIEVKRVLKGNVRDGCIMGLAGLRAGKKYVVFLRGESDGGVCSNPSLFGVLDPTALEVDKAHGLDSSEQVKLDVLSIIPPHFPDSTVRRNIAISIDGEETVTTVGTVVPLSSFINYLESVFHGGESMRKK